MNEKIANNNVCLLCHTCLVQHAVIPVFKTMLFFVSQADPYSTTGTGPGVVYVTVYIYRSLLYNGNGSENQLMRHQNNSARV